MARDSSLRGRWWYEEELSTPAALSDIDTALDTFDRSKWKERVNKVLIQEKETPPDNDPYDRPLNRFR